MPTVDIGANSYQSYADIDQADEYLEADLSRSTAWAALPSDTKGRALVTATRYLLGLAWLNGAPDLDTPPVAVIEATSLFAADIAAKPALGNDASTGSNVKRVKGGEAEVEFFRPSSGSILPPYLLRLLGSLLGTDVTWGEGGTAYGSEDCQNSRFDRTDWRLNESYS